MRKERGREEGHRVGAGSRIDRKEDIDHRGKDAKQG